MAALRGASMGRVAEGFPHVHHGKADAFGLLFAKPVIELPHAVLRAVESAKPDGASTDQVADHDAIGVPFADRDFVYADGLGCRGSGTFQLCRHVLLVQCLHGMPVQMQFAGDVRHRAGAAAPADIPGKPLGIERVVGEKVESFPFHFAAVPTEHPSDLDFQIDARISTGEVAYPSESFVVPAGVHPATGVADGFFERRTRVMTRALGSPKRPRIFSKGRKPGNRYASSNRLCWLEMTIGKPLRILEHVQRTFCPMPRGLQRFSC